VEVRHGGTSCCGKFYRWSVRLPTNETRPGGDGFFPTAGLHVRLALHKHNGIRTPACSVILWPNGVRIKLRVGSDL
nr:hypothetical protein [Burkholderiales bacterium]